MFQLVRQINVKPSYRPRRSLLAALDPGRVSGYGAAGFSLMLSVSEGPQKDLRLGGFCNVGRAFPGSLSTPH
jgi:hypothetical protein